MKINQITKRLLKSHFIIPCALLNFASSAYAFDVPIETFYYSSETCDSSTAFNQTVNIFDTTFATQTTWLANPLTSGTDVLSFQINPDPLAPTSLGFQFSKDLSITSGNNTVVDLFYVSSTGAETHWPGSAGPHINLGTNDVTITASFFTNDGIISVDPLNSAIGTIAPGAVRMNLRITNATTGANLYAFGQDFLLDSQSEFDLPVPIGGVTYEVTNGCIVPETSSALLCILGGGLIMQRKRK